MADREVRIQVQGLPKRPLRLLEPFSRAGWQVLRHDVVNPPEPRKEVGLGVWSEHSESQGFDGMQKSIPSARQRLVKRGDAVMSPMASPI